MLLVDGGIVKVAVALGLGLAGENLTFECSGVGMKVSTWLVIGMSNPFLLGQYGAILWKNLRLAVGTIL